MPPARDKRRNAGLLGKSPYVAGVISGVHLGIRPAIDVCVTMLRWVETVEDRAPLTVDHWLFVSAVGGYPRVPLHLNRVTILLCLFHVAFLVSAESPWMNSSTLSTDQQGCLL